MNTSALRSINRNSPEYRRIKISSEEVTKRRRIQRHSLGSFAVDNLPMNPETRFLFNDYVEGKIATKKEVKDVLIAYYTQK